MFIVESVILVILFCSLYLFQVLVKINVGEEVFNYIVFICCIFFSVIMNLFYVLKHEDFKVIKLLFLIVLVSLFLGIILFSISNGLLWTFVLFAIIFVLFPYFLGGLFLGVVVSFITYYFNIFLLKIIKI